VGVGGHVYRVCISWYIIGDSRLNFLDILVVDLTYRLLTKKSISDIFKMLPLILKIKLMKLKPEVNLSEKSAQCEIRCRSVGHLQEFRN